MVVLAVHGVLQEVLERVVHPAEVPLQPEAQAAGYTGRDTMGQAVDSSAMVWVSG